MDLSKGPGRRVAVIVAHPDDETLWAGGLLLSHPEWSTFILGLTHGGDPDRGGRFQRMLEVQGARGALGGVEDGGREDDRPEGELERTLLSLVPARTFDLILTHSPQGEYTEHVLHDEVSNAVGRLVAGGQLETTELWHFAYEDEGGACLPYARTEASLRLALSEAVWREKRRIIKDVYGFSEDAWETRVTPRIEGFMAAGSSPRP